MEIDGVEVVETSDGVDNDEGEDTLHSAWDEEGAVQDEEEDDDEVHALFTVHFKFLAYLIYSSG